MMPLTRTAVGGRRPANSDRRETVRMLDPRVDRFVAAAATRGPQCSSRSPAATLSPASLPNAFALSKSLAKPGMRSEPILCFLHCAKIACGNWLLRWPRLILTRRHRSDASDDIGKFLYPC